jgi:hypothetical protein
MIGTATSAAAEDRTRRKEDSSDAVVAPSTQSRRICRSNARREDCVMARKPPKQQRTKARSGERGIVSVATVKYQYQYQ